MARLKYITRETELPGYARATATHIKRFSFTWRFVEEQPLADIILKRVQVRDITQLAPPHEVNRYSEAMKRGDQFPPVIVTSDGYLVDGATRTLAAAKREWLTFPAFVLDVNFEGAIPEQRSQLIYMGAGFNLTHGRGMNTKNVADIISQVTGVEDTPGEVARKLHISTATASTLLNAANARKRAVKLGVEVNGALTNSALKLFGGKSAKFTDPVFSEFFRLAQDAKLPYTTLTNLAKRLESAGTEHERIDILAEERAAYRDIIEGGATSPSKAAQLRQKLGFLLNVEDPEKMVEHEAGAIGQHNAALAEAARKLMKVIEAQQNADKARR
jgi:hypothetical protein